ncbi:MAG: APC family permease, partial [Bdellovibrionales bacterium]|nr:APC family permease [Bdellovibrionales bacterium]
FSVFYIYNHPDILMQNFADRWTHTPSPVKALYLGFAAAMLGISGFESSANFIEEQEEGVFPKTLKNMWLAVSIFNPLLCFLALGIVNVGEISNHSTSLLSHMGDVSAGGFLKTLISIDAVLVLSGAVLTSYVGVIGLVRRMSLDRCLPQVFLTQNEWKGTNHWIIISFFILCSLILFATQGDVERLAGVYTLSFLCVMALFAIGNLLLKFRRGRLPREERANPAFVVLALFGIVVGLSGNLTTSNILIFSQFLALVLGVVLVMLYRIQILKIFLTILKSFISVIKSTSSKMFKTITNTVDEINSQEMIFFTKDDDLPTLNAAALYVLENELSSTLTVVYVYKKGESVPSVIAEHLKTIDRIYPGLKINFLSVEGEFGPDLIESLSKRLDIPKNFMFIGTPGDRFPYRISELGGVRLIIG